MGQDVFYAPTVFNYFPAEFKIPGTSVIAPPMGIHNTNTVLARSDVAYGLLYEGGLSRDEEVAGSLALAGPDDAGDEGQWIPTTAMDQYGAALASWFGVPAAALSQVFANVQAFANPVLGFV